MIELKKKEQEHLDLLIQKGSEITGRIGGGLVGGILGGFAGIAVGAAYGSVLGELLKTAGMQVKQWSMGERQYVRVGATYFYATERIQYLLKEGSELRDDDYFQDKKNNRSAATEILEGALLHSQNEYEELKLKHYGYLLANFAFCSDINRGKANFLLRLAEKLSFRQLCFLQILDNDYSHKLFIPYNPPKPKPEPHPFLTGVVWSQYEQPLLSQSVIFSPLYSSSQNYLTQNIKLKAYELSPDDILLDVKELYQLGLLKESPETVKTYKQVTLSEIGKLFREMLLLRDLDSKEIKSYLPYFQIKETKQEYEERNRYRLT